MNAEKPRPNKALKRLLIEIDGCVAQVRRAFPPNPASGFTFARLSSRVVDVKNPRFVEFCLKTQRLSGSQQDYCSMSLLASRKRISSKCRVLAIAKEWLPGAKVSKHSLSHRCGMKASVIRFFK
jgi:hypothetical protein